MVLARPVAQVVASQVPEQTLGRIEPRRVRRKEQDRDAGRHLERPADVPSGPVHHDDRMVALVEDEGPTSRERLGDGERLASPDRLHDREPSITLLRCGSRRTRVPRFAGSPLRRSVTCMRAPVQGRRVMQRTGPSRNPNRRRTARETDRDSVSPPGRSRGRLAAKVGNSRFVGVRVASSGAAPEGRRHVVDRSPRGSSNGHGPGTRSQVLLDGPSSTREVRRGPPARRAKQAIPQRIVDAARRCGWSSPGLEVPIDPSHRT